MGTQVKNDQILTKDQLLAHWQGHRALTRRVIEAFPENELFSFSIGGMSPFGELVAELVAIAVPGIVGLATGNPWMRRILRGKTRQNFSKFGIETRSKSTNGSPKYLKGGYRKRCLLLGNTRTKATAP